MTVDERRTSVMTPEQRTAWDLTKASNRLYRLYAYRINKLCRLYNCRYVCEHDLFSVGRFAAYRYALDVGADFARPLANVIARRAMIRAFDTAAGLPGSAKRTGLAAAVTPFDDADPGDPALRTFDPESDLDIGIFSPAVWRALQGLGDRCRRVILMRVADGLMLDEIGRVFGITKERVRQIEIRGLQQLRENLTPPPDGPPPAE